MSDKSKQIAPVTHHVGYVYAAPSAPVTNVSTYKASNNSYEMQNTSRSVYKDAYDGTKTTTRYSEVHKGGDFVDRRSGNTGYREEVRFQQTQRVNDKAQGFTKEYQTEVKVKETTTYHNNSNYNRGGGYKYNNGGDYYYE